MTIIEKVKEAEEKASLIIKEAKEEVSKNLEMSRKSDLEKFDEIINKADDTIESLKRQCQEEIKNLTDEVLLVTNNLKQNDTNNALSHQKKAIDFIIEKVKTS